jgi:acyl-CoA thioesterase-1
MVPALGQADRVEQPVRPLPGVGVAKQLERQEDVLLRGEIAEQLERLEHESDLVPSHEGQPTFGQIVDAFAIEADRASSRPVEPRHQREQRRLAAAGWADDGDELALPDLEVDPVEDRQRLAAGRQLSSDAAQCEQGGLVGLVVRWGSVHGVVERARNAGRSVVGPISILNGMIHSVRFRHAFSALTLVFVALWASGCSEAPAPNREPSPTAADSTGPADVPARNAVRIVFLGDSLSAGYGLAETQAFPALVEGALRAEGLAVDVVNAGVSGDTSAGGLSRIDWVMRGEPDLVVVELGGNDALRGQPLENTERNLREIVRRARLGGAGVLLLGMDVPTNYGPEYAGGFAELYARIAADLDVDFVPGFVREVGLDRSLMQPDGLHPTAEGHRRLAEALIGPLREVMASGHEP